MTVNGQIRGWLPPTAAGDCSLWRADYQDDVSGACYEEDLDESEVQAALLAFVEHQSMLQQQQRASYCTITAGADSSGSISSQFFRDPLQLGTGGASSDARSVAGSVSSVNSGKAISVASKTSTNALKPSQLATKGTADQSMYLLSCTGTRNAHLVSATAFASYTTSSPTPCVYVSVHVLD